MLNPSWQKPYVCKIQGCTKRYTDPSSLRKHVKTVHGPEAHVTKKQRNDVPPRQQPPKGNGENEANSKHGARVVDGKIEANSTSRGVEDCIQIKSIKTETSMVSPVKNDSAQLFSVHEKSVCREIIITELNLWDFYGFQPRSALFKITWSYNCMAFMFLNQQREAQTYFLTVFHFTNISLQG